MRSSNYAFATGKIRFLETKLLNLNDVERMIDAPNLESSFRALYDTDYADNLSELAVENFEKAVVEDLGQLKELLIKIIVDQDFLKLLFLEYDFFNLKVLFKEKLFQKDLSYLLINLGFFPTEKLRALIFDDQPLVGGEEIKDVINLANSLFKENPEPHRLEFYFDKKYFTLLRLLAKKLRNKFIIDYVNFKINLVNLRMFLRLKKSNLASSEMLSEVLIEGGDITIEDFIKLAPQELLAITNYLTKKFPNRFAKYFSDYLEHQKFWFLEKRLFEEEIDYLRRAKSIAYGPEILMAYFYAKRNANKNIRLIMNGKLNQIDNLILKERVRKLY